MSDSKHLVNPELQAMAWMKLAQIVGPMYAKQAFVPAGDPSMDPNAAAAGGGGGAPPPGGPPGAPPGGDPSGGGGGPPPGGGAPPAIDPSAIAAQVMQMMQAQGGGAGAGGGMGGGMVEPIKPKIDVNVEMLQIKKMLAKICDAMGIHIPASDMAVTSQDLTSMAMGQGSQPQSSIPPIQPIGGAGPGMSGGGAGGVKTGSQHFNNGTAFDPSTAIGFDTSGLAKTASTASAIAQIRGLRKTA